MVKNIKGISPSLVTIANDSLNIFVARFNDTDVFLRQPRRNDIGKQKLAWRDVSEESRKRYRRLNADPNIYDMGYRSKLPLYRGEVPGFMPLVLEADDRIVGFVDAYFKYGKELPRYNILPEEKAISCSVCVLDKYQGMGYGEAYSYLSDEVGRYFKMDWIVGVAYLKGGTHHIRARHGWETIRKYGQLADHRKRLSPMKTSP